MPHRRARIALRSASGCVPPLGRGNTGTLIAVSAASYQPNGIQTPGIWKDPSGPGISSAKTWQRCIAPARLRLERRAGSGESHGSRPTRFGRPHGRRRRRRAARPRAPTRVVRPGNCPAVAPARQPSSSPRPSPQPVTVAARIRRDADHTASPWVTTLDSPTVVRIAHKTDYLRSVRHTEWSYQESKRIGGRLRHRGLSPR